MNERLQEAEALWALIARIIAFIFGCGMLGWETVHGAQRAYIIVAGIGLCGPTVAQSVATVFAAIRGGGRDDASE
jgi:hypothetical protein